MPPAPAAPPTRAADRPRAIPTFDVAVDLPDATFPAHAEGAPVEPAPARASQLAIAAGAIAADPEVAIAAAKAPAPREDEPFTAAAAPVEAAQAEAEGAQAEAPAVVAMAAVTAVPTAASEIAAGEVAAHAATEDAEVPPEGAPTPTEAHASETATTEPEVHVTEAPAEADAIDAALMLAAAPEFSVAAAAADAAADPDAPAEPARETPRAPVLMPGACVRIDGATLRPVPGVVLPARVLLDAHDVAPLPAASSDDALLMVAGRTLILPPGEEIALPAWDATAAPIAGDAPMRSATARLAPYAFIGGAACVAVAAAFLRPGVVQPASPANGARTAAPVPAALALPTVEPGPTAVPSPTGLAASLAVVNPANRPTATPPAEIAVPAGSVAGRAAVGLGGAISGTLGSDFPFNLDIVTPTPNSAAERLLFRDPLVAAEAPAGVGADGAPDYQARVVSLEQPVILPALESERNGGAAVAALSLDELARPRILPAMAVARFPDIATPIPTAPPAPTAIPIALAPGRAWSTFTPSDATHFWVGRPHPAFVQNQIAAPSYQFGSTGGGRYRPHHGMDIANPFGTPVRAATTGAVVHAGLDDPDVLGPYPNFYGNAVVIRLDRRLTVAGGEMDVFLLYGHMSEVTVQAGQRVQPDDIVGMVGMTGIAIGPHLHVEIRVGANTYEASVNPYLWVAPPPGDGAVAVRLLTADGRTWPNARITLARFEGNLATWARVLENYPDNESINPDPSFGDTSAMDAVPAGVYYLVAVVNGERVAAEVTVEAGKTTFVEMRTQQ